MMFSVPTNWQDDLLPKLNHHEITEVYGKLARDFIGGGRPSYAIQHISKRQTARHIDLILKAGLKFNYLLNATCLGNKEWTRDGQKQIRALLDWIASIGVEKVTITVPYLLELVKKRYPQFEVSVSTSAGVNSLERALYWEDLGADSITLDSVDVNRNFRLLRQIRKALKCKIQLIANLNCLHNCPFDQYHYLLASHASQSEHSNKGFFLDYCYLKCNYHRIKNPKNLIRADWIRPEDVCSYEDIGIDRIKLVDRTMPTRALSSIITAYVNRHYEGNLLDLFVAPRVAITRQKFGVFHKLKYFFHPFLVNPFRIYRTKDLFFGIFYIDNRSLDGFLEYFIKNDCASMSCQECGYCADVANRVIRYDVSLQQRLIVEYEKYLDGLASGSVFKYTPLE